MKRSQKVSHLLGGGRTSSSAELASNHHDHLLPRRDPFQDEGTSSPSNQSDFFGRFQLITTEREREREREDGLRVGLTMHASMCTYMIWFEKFWSVYQKLGHTTKRKPFSFKTVFSTIVLRLAAIQLEHVNLPIAHPSSMWWIIVFNFGQRNQPTHNSLN